MQAAPDVLVPQQTSLPIPEVLQAPPKLNDAPGTHVPIPTLPFITVSAAVVVLVVPIPTPPPFPILMRSKEFVLKVKSPELDAELLM